MAPRNCATIIAARLPGRANAAAYFLRVLANEHRLRVLCLLLGRESSVGEMNAVIGVSQSALSQHLAAPRAHKLVGTRRGAQSIHDSLAPGPVSAVIEALHVTFCRHRRQSELLSAACTPPR